MGRLESLPNSACCLSRREGRVPGGRGLPPYRFRVVTTILKPPGRQILEWHATADPAHVSFAFHPGAFRSLIGAIITMNQNANVVFLLTID